jgi:nicotinamidase-related amidase
MRVIRHALVLCAVASAMWTGPAAAQSGNAGVMIPPAPEPVPVSVKASNTALIVLDLVDPICTREPRCMDKMLAPATALLGRARSAGMFVLYGTRGPTLSKWLPDVAPRAGDVVIQSFAQDRFYNTELDKILKEKGITTLILMGWKVSGSVTYTSVGATVRNYTVVVPVDASMATTDHETAVGHLPDSQSGRFQSDQPAAENKSHDAQPHRSDYDPVRLVRTA